MNLYQVKKGKKLRWPAALTPEPKGHKHTRLGLARHKEKNRVERGLEGFVVDMDAPGERFFCDEVESRFLEPVPAADRADALARVEAQGPITFQPALDWLDDQGLRARVARPEPPAPVESDGPEGWDRARLVEECDRLGIETGRRRTETLREALVERLTSPPDDAAVEEDSE
jgi:hypothetical protein